MLTVKPETWKCWVLYNSWFVKVIPSSTCGCNLPHPQPSIYVHKWWMMSWTWHHLTMKSQTIMFIGQSQMYKCIIIHTFIFGGRVTGCMHEMYIIYKACNTKPLSLVQWNHWKNDIAVYANWTQNAYSSACCHSLCVISCHWWLCCWFLRTFFFLHLSKEEMSDQL